MDTKDIIEVNEDALEPSEYFKILKGKLEGINEEELQRSLNYVADQILAAKRVGQKSFLRQLSFTGDALLKEQILLSRGIKDYVLRDDIKQFILNVNPKNSIKIIELERYPRAIPLEVLQKISEVQTLNLFDDYCIVFTDLTNEDYSTPEEKKFVARNRDPIVFGFFRDPQTGKSHDRFYFIADWEDEHCDLTFSKLIDKMSKQGFKKPGNEISNDHNYLQNLIKSSLKETEEKKTLTNQQIKKETFRQKIEKLFKW